MRGDYLAQPKSKIDKLGLGNRVLSLRKDLTCEEVADIINKQYLPAGAEPLNKMTVSRYCSDHGLTDMERNDITKGVTRFNALSEAWSVRNRLIRHTNKLGKILDDLKEDEEKLSEISSISNAYLNSCKFLEDLNESVSKIQKEQLGLEKVRKVLMIFLEILNKYPQVKSEVFERLRKSDAYEIVHSI